MKLQLKKYIMDMIDNGRCPIAVQMGHREGVCNETGTTCIRCWMEEFKPYIIKEKP